MQRHSRNTYSFLRRSRHIPYVWEDHYEGGLSQYLFLLAKVKTGKYWKTQKAPFGVAIPIPSCEGQDAEANEVLNAPELKEESQYLFLLAKVKTIYIAKLSSEHRGIVAIPIPSCEGQDFL